MEQVDYLHHRHPLGVASHIPLLVCFESSQIQSIRTILQQQYHQQLPNNQVTVSTQTLSLMALQSGARGGDMAGHPLQTNPQIDTSKHTVADNPCAPCSCTINPRKDQASLMKAVTWQGKHKVSVKELPKPLVTDDEDVVIRVTSTAICGSDLHLYEGYMPGMQKDDIIGHEFMGIVESKGPGVKSVNAGDRVVVSFDIGCSRCSFCRQGMFTSCSTTNASSDQAAMYGHSTSGMFGYSHMTSGYEGGQAEYVRVPFADTNTLKVPSSLKDEQVLFLSDILATAWHANEMGEVSEGKNVAIWGAGPVGILAAQCAFHRGAARVVLIDKQSYRLEHAKKHIKGLEIIDYSSQKVEKSLHEMFPEFQGPDVVIEAVGFHYAKTMLHAVEQKLGLETDPADMLNEMVRSVRKGGMISIVGVYAGFMNHFNIGAFMEKGCTMRGGQTPVQRYWHTLLEKVEQGVLDPSIVITHVLPLEEAPHAYKIFDAKTDGCIKVVMKPPSQQAQATA
jgi:threonine dehydrogenase-like Zn-dependent dehydrogenase